MSAELLDLLRSRRKRAKKSEKERKPGVVPGFFLGLTDVGEWGIL